MSLTAVTHASSCSLLHYCCQNMRFQDFGVQLGIGRSLGTVVPFTQILKSSWQQGKQRERENAIHPRAAGVAAQLHFKARLPEKSRRT